ncbi:MAG: response regulator, partial [Proteobacteria bacterium]
VIGNEWFADGALGGKKMLIVDDTDDNIVLICAYLQRSGLKIDNVADGIAALENIKSISYDLILMDIQMPLLDGIETCFLMRMRGLTQPIVACTAIGLSPSEIAGANFNAFLPKPIFRDALFECLSDYLIVQS